MHELIAKYAQKVVELEREIAAWKRRCYDLELEIVGKDHEIMTLQESSKCDPCECLDD